MSGPARAAVVSVGNELLFGETIDSNSAWLGRTLTAWGLTVVSGSTTRDRSDEIQEAVSRSLSIAEVVVVSGGLGPTPDDVTKGAVSELLGLALATDPRTLEQVRRRFVAAGYDEIPALSESQAEVPAGAVPLRNEHGTAPGILIDHEGRVIVLLPGVPREMISIASGPLREAFAARGLIATGSTHRVIHTTGIRETSLAELVDERVRAMEPELRASVGLAYLPDELGVDLRLTVEGRVGAEAEALFDAFEEAIAGAVAEWRFESVTGDLADAVADELLRRGWTLSAAESCTGGLVAKRMTDRVGASEVFLGAVVAYDNAVKVGQVGVSEDDIARDGAVSETVARQMAVGVAERLGADVGVAITGVAGPGGGSEEKPVGTVWVSTAAGGAIETRLHRFAGDRSSVRRQAAQAALALVYRQLMDLGAEA